MNRPLGLAFGAAFAGALLSGCAVGPNFERSISPPMASSFAGPSEGNSVRASEAAPPPLWWRMFDDPMLDELESRIAAQNLDVQTATARVQQSRARSRIAGAVGSPVLGATGSYQRQRANPNGPSGAPAAASAAAFDTFVAGVDVAWELDIWGRARRTAEAAGALEQAAVEDRRFALLSVQAEIARTYVALRGSQAQLAILDDNLRISRDSMRMAKSRFENGVTTRLDVANAEAEVATIEASIPSAEAARDQYINSLSLLLAMAPHTLEAELTAPRPLPNPPSSMPVGLSSDLLRRRPDVRRSEAALHAATAEIGVAKADLYPRISLTGSLGSEALQLSDLGSWSSRQLAIGPSIVLPIFEGGRRRGTLDLRTAQQQEAAIEYQRTVLAAWHEVDNALTAYRAEDRRRASLNRAVDENMRALSIAQHRYQEGAIDFLNVLSVQKSLLDSRSTLIVSSIAASQSVIALYKALGGGWQSQFPEPAD